MRFVNDRCPVCGEHVAGITEATRVYRGLARDASGGYDYDGRYLELLETEEPYLLTNGNVLVECEQGHEWETPLVSDARPTGGSLAPRRSPNPDPYGARGA